MRVCVFELICVRVCLHVAAAVKVGYWGEVFWFQLASERPLCSSARAGRAGEEGGGSKGGGDARGGVSSWVGESWTSKQQRTAGAIIPPNAPCLPHVCSGSLVSGRLSALMQKVTWVIKCSCQGWGQYRPPVFSGRCGPLFAQSSRSGCVFLPLIQQTSARCVVGCHALCNRPCPVWTVNACWLGRSQTRHCDQSGMRLYWNYSPVWRIIDPLDWFCILFMLHALFHPPPLIKIL